MHRRENNVVAAWPAERMTPVDRAWLEMDEPRNPMVVSAVIELEGVASVTAFGRTMVERLIRYPRFLERPDDARQPPRWTPDKDFNLGYHLHVRRLPRGPRARDGRALRAAVEAELAAELDRGRPLWRITLFPQNGRRLTVLFRAHHALADGVALVQVLMNCTDAAVRKSPAMVHPHSGRETHGGPLGRWVDRLEGFNELLEGLETVVVDDLQHPSHLVAQLRSGRRALSAVRRLMALPQDNPSALRQPLSGQRRVAWLADLPLTPVRRLARRLGVKLNDVYMTVLTGALRDALRARDPSQTNAQNLRVSIPVNLRQNGDAALGNCFGLVLLDLPIAIEDPLVRLRTVTARMEALKHSPEAKAVLASLAAAGYLPVRWEKKLVDLIGGKAAAVVSNLPGPRRTVKIAGARISNLVFWPPQTAGIGLGVSLFSYAGRFSLGICADTALMPDPQPVLDAFLAELERLQRVARTANDAPRATRRRTAHTTGMN